MAAATASASASASAAAFLLLPLLAAAATAGHGVCPRQPAAAAVLPRQAPAASSSSSSSSCPAAGSPGHRAHHVGVVENVVKIWSSCLSDTFPCELYNACMNPVSLDAISLERMEEAVNIIENDKKTEQGDSLFMFARSPDRLLHQDTCLALASSFVLMRLLRFLLPKLNACVKQAWRMQFYELKRLFPSLS
uniref:Pectinesterase inhibitor domain-containing protein n=1 Tax=Oryza barthii TaxID=65489 RepID=A0A0D3H070_9ORYZ